MNIQSARRFSKSERGQTLVITAVGMVAVLAMTVLAIDIVALYVAKDQVQATADAAASAVATAEVYNPSFDLNPGPPIQIHGVKPWLIFNYNSCGSGAAYFTSTYAVANGGTFIGQPVTLNLMSSATTLPAGVCPSPANT